MTSSIQFHAFEAKHHSAGLQKSSHRAKDLTSDRFEDHVSQSREKETEIGFDGREGLGGGVDVAETENSGETTEDSAPTPEGESAGNLHVDDGREVAEADNLVLEARTGRDDQENRISLNGGKESKVRPAMGDLSGVGLSDGTGSRAPAPSRSTGEMALSEDLRATGSAPSGFPEVDALANLRIADEFAKSGFGDMRREFSEPPQLESDGSLSPSHKSSVSNPERSEHHLAIGRDTPQRMGSLVLPLSPGQRHPPMAGEWQYKHQPDRSFLSEFSYETPVQATDRGRSLVIRQHATGSASILLAQGTDQTIHPNLTALSAIQGKLGHQFSANNSQTGERPVPEVPQSIILPPLESTANLSGPLVTATQPFNVFSGASLVGVGGLNQVQPAVLQILDAIGKSADGAIVVALNPRELGQVRMSLMASETGFVVSITAERAETLDIMRRHSEALMDEFRRFGFENPDLEFSHGGWDFNPGSGGGAAAAIAETEHEQLSQAPQATRNRARETTGLDMRI